MKLSKRALDEIRKNTRLKTLLALASDRSVFTVEKWLKDNESNGDLTKATAIKIIREETKIPESKILVSENAIVG